MDETPTTAIRMRQKAADDGRSFAFRFFLRYGDFTDVTVAPESALAKQFFKVTAAEAMAEYLDIDEIGRTLLTDYARDAVEVAFNERLQVLAAHHSSTV